MVTTNRFSIEQVFELSTSELVYELERVTNLLSLCSDEASHASSHMNQSELEAIKTTMEEELRERQSTDCLISALSSSVDFTQLDKKDENRNTLFMTDGEVKLTRPYSAPIAGQQRILTNIVNRTHQKDMTVSSGRTKKFQFDATRINTEEKRSRRKPKSDNDKSGTLLKRSTSDYRINSSRQRNSTTKGTHSFSCTALIDPKRVKDTELNSITVYPISMDSMSFEKPEEVSVLEVVDVPYEQARIDLEVKSNDPVDIDVSPTVDVSKDDNSTEYRKNDEGETNEEESYVGSLSIPMFSMTDSNDNGQMETEVIDNLLTIGNDTSEDEKSTKESDPQENRLVNTNAEEYDGHMNVSTNKIIKSHNKRPEEKHGVDTSWETIFVRSNHFREKVSMESNMPQKVEPMTLNISRTLPTYTDYSPFFINIFSIMSRFFNYSQSAFSGSTQRGSKTLINFDSRQRKQYLKEMLEVVRTWKFELLSNREALVGKTNICRVQEKEEIFELLNTATSSINDSKETAQAKWIVTQSETNCWNLYWAWSSNNKPNRSNMFVFQLFNHFPNAKHLTRKDLLNKHISRYQKTNSSRGRSEFDIIPAAYVLPANSVQFLEHFGELRHKIQLKESLDPNCALNIWIIKPVGASRGRGIYLMNDVTQLNHISHSYGTNVVVQKYIERPLLLRRGKKFDLRLYVLVTRFSPLEAFIYREGFARFASERYTTQSHELDNKFIHLTNTAIQDNYCDVSERTMDTKCTLEELKYLLEQEYGHVSYDVLWERMIQTVLSSLYIVEKNITEDDNNSRGNGNGTKRHQHGYNPVNHFELYGYDILFDQTFKPWLIEVNASPSMECHIPIDYQVKNGLIRDTIQLLDPLHCNMNELESVIMQLLSSPMSTNNNNNNSNAQNNNNKLLHQIFNGKRPRAFGEMPRNMGLYQRIAPLPG